MGAGHIITLIALFMAVFGFGVTAGLFLDSLQQSREELTLSAESPEGLLPYDRIKKEDVHVFADHVRIDLANARWANFSPTGSMLPTLGPAAHAIQIIPQSPDDIHVGDIISFRVSDKIISHRVLFIGNDEHGPYFITQGDNNIAPDEPVRFEQVDRVVIAILY